MDWDSDPEMKKLREDFIGSLAARHSQVVSILKWMTGARAPGGASDLSTVLPHLIEFCHKLAGVAESYGFETLSLISGALEDWLTLDAHPEIGKLHRSLQLLDEALVSSQVERVNPEKFVADPRMAELISVALSFRAGSKPGPS